MSASKQVTPRVTKRARLTTEEAESDAFKETVRMLTEDYCLQALEDYLDETEDPDVLQARIILISKSIGIAKENLIPRFLTLPGFDVTRGPDHKIRDIWVEGSKLSPEQVAVVELVYQARKEQARVVVKLDESKYFLVMKDAVTEGDMVIFDTGCQKILPRGEDEDLLVHCVTSMVRVGSIMTPIRLQAFSTAATAMLTDLGLERNHQDMIDVINLLSDKDMNFKDVHEFIQDHRQSRPLTAFMGYVLGNLASLLSGQELLHQISGATASELATIFESWGKLFLPYATSNKQALVHGDSLEYVEAISLSEVKRGDRVLIASNPATANQIANFHNLSLKVIVVGPSGLKRPRRGKKGSSEYDDYQHETEDGEFLLSLATAINSAKGVKKPSAPSTPAMEIESGVSESKVYVSEFKL